MNGFTQLHSASLALACEVVGAGGGGIGGIGDKCIQWSVVMRTTLYHQGPHHCLDGRERDSRTLALKLSNSEFMLCSMGFLQPSPLFGWEGEGLSNSQTLKLWLFVWEFASGQNVRWKSWLGSRLACVCHILKLKFSTHASGGELCATATGVDCGTIRKVPQNPGTSEYWTLNLELWSCTLNFDLWMLQGLNILIPIVDRIKYVQSLKEKAIDIPSQSAITEGNLAHLQVGGKWSNLKFYFCYPDNVTLHLDGVLYYRVINPFKVGGYTVVYWVSMQSVQWNYTSVCCFLFSLLMVWRMLSLQWYSWPRQPWGLNWVCGIL